MSRGKSGHFCWCCRRMRPNERFSGRNHARHLCRDCARLPMEERQYRQADRNLADLERDAEEWRRMCDADEAWATGPVRGSGEADAGVWDSGATAPELDRDDDLEDDVPF